MTNSPLKPPHEVRPPTDILKLVLVGGVVMLAVSILVLMVLPFLIIPAIIAVPILVVMMMTSLARGEKQIRLAQQIAASHIDPSRGTELNVIEHTEEAGLDDGDLILNDWGIIYVKPGQMPIEVSWNEINRIEEPGTPGVLRVNTNRVEFDVAPRRYFLIAEVLQDKCKGQTNFDVDPVTGESHVMMKLARQARVLLSGSLIVDSKGIEWRGKRVGWNEINYVNEIEISTEDSITRTYELQFETYTGRFKVGITQLDLKDYALLKAIVEQQIPGRFSYHIYSKTVKDRARDEFDWLRETTKAAILVARWEKRRGTSDVLESHLPHMYNLINRYGLKGAEVSEFISDYAKLLRATGRESQADQMERRMSDR